MKILIDIMHPADVNFFKRAVQRLCTEHEITIWVRDRGKLKEIATEESNLPIRSIGRHYSSVWGKFFSAFQRIGNLLRHCRKNSYDVLTSFGGYHIGIVAKLTGQHAVVFYDDYEYRLNFLLGFIFSSSYVIPSSLCFSTPKVSTYYGFKEWAYLQNFTPVEDICNRYQLKKKAYVFIRHVASTSLNYRHQNYRDLIIDIVKFFEKRHIHVLMSVEDKKIKKYLPGTHFVQEPCKEIHSLIYYAACTISSGDTVARESALLSVPTFYIGNRKMRVNGPLIDAGLLKHTPGDTVFNALKKCMDSNERINLTFSWDDTTEVIVRHLLNR